jgi:drug/metabolite transporter (DMT)-like permease
VKHRLFLGISFTLLAMLAYSLLAVLVKTHASTLPIPIVIFAQCMLCCAFMLMIVLTQSGFKGLRGSLKTMVFPLHMIRILANLSINYLLFFSVKYIPLVNSMLLANTAPLMVPFIAYFFMRQKINHQLWLPLCIGFIGVSIVLRPSGDFFQAGGLLALGAAATSAITLVVVRKLSATESPTTINLYFFLFATFIAAFIAFPYRIPLSFDLCKILFIMGILFFICQYLMTYALIFIHAELVGALMYSRVIYSALLSIVLWQFFPSPLCLLGISLAFVGCLWCIYIEYAHHQLAKQTDTEQSDYALKVN